MPLILAHAHAHGEALLGLAFQAAAFHFLGLDNVALFKFVRRVKFQRGCLVGLICRYLGRREVRLKESELHVARGRGYLSRGDAHRLVACGNCCSFLGRVGVDSLLEGTN